MFLIGTWGCSSCSSGSGSDDAAIRKEIVSVLDASNIKGIDVSVVNATVTLSGTADQATADRAAEIARGAKGVQSVTNQITIAGAGGTVPVPTGPAPDVDLGQEDQRLASAVNQRLAAEAALAGSRLNVPTVTAGVATLTGTVPSDAAKAAAEKAARSVAGITNVVNQLQVVAAVTEPPVPDDQIKASVEELLDTQFSDLTVFVKVTGGVVELSGALPNAGFVLQITNAVRQLKGVKSVDTTRFTITGGESGDKKIGAPATKN